MALRRRRELANPLVFFVVVVSLFPLGVSPERAFLAEAAPGVVWVSALLATLLSMDAMFRSDFEDGSLEQLLLLPVPNVYVVAAKILAHWLSTGLPLILLAPVMAFLLHLPSEGLSTLVLTLLLGTPILSLLGAIGVALTLALRSGGVLLSLLVLPLYIPILIFATAAVNASIDGMAVSGFYALLGAGLILSALFAPFAVTSALKVSFN